MSPSWQVHKFGGTCLADASRIEHAAGIAASASEDGDAGHVAVVVSAMGGVTDELIRAAELAANGDAEYRDVLRRLQERTAVTCERLLSDAAGVVLAAVAEDVGDLKDVLRGVEIAGVCPDSTLELVSGYGELWSARTFCAHLLARGHQAVWLDARDVLVVEHDETGPAVVWAETVPRFAGWSNDHPAPFVVITGFVARDPAGVPTTLKRNGSDFSASIFARLLEASSITIWTDVDGVMSADPRLVPEAKVLPELSYSEAMELAYFGAEILHPQTMAPAIERGIPILIRNAFDLDAPGTAIRADHGAASEPARAVKGISSVADVALLSLEGAGMIGVPGVASRMFTALREVDVSVVMISQASSEHSVCAAIPAGQAEVARHAVERAFAAELIHGQVQSVDVSGPYSILAAVGDNMVETRGVAARFFGALGRAGINVRAIAQGASERNISAVVAAGDAPRALRAVHAGFYLSEQTISVGLLGPGQVGAELLRQFAAQASYLKSRFHIELQVRAIVTSKRMLLADDGVDLSCWSRELDTRGVSVDLSAFTGHVQASHLPHAVIIDCSASAAVADHYVPWLEQGIHVITPNKKANSGALADYRRLRELGDRVATRYLYEATVGAGLPVISTLRDLLETGDRIRRIEGVLSGSLSFLLSSLRCDVPFSSLVREARSRGYTEPHPRDDLSGLDVARKAVILGREIGLTLALEDVPVESLVPEALRDCHDPDRFVDQLAAFDKDIEVMRVVAEQAGEVLRYVAVIEAGGKVVVGLRRYDADSVFARIQGGDNILVFTTDRYAEQPLIVQGPGAGPVVTAAGVFGDLLRLASSLGAPR